MDKILKEMVGITNRKARFKTVISLVINGERLQFEGVVNGVILNEKRGSSGYAHQ
jgi:XTP/dITP diphosphohydrolase